MSKPNAVPLQPDVLEIQIAALDLLGAMFPDPSETSMSSSDANLIETLRDDPTLPTPPDVSLAIQIHLDKDHAVQVNITVPLRTTDPGNLEPPEMLFTLRQPPWLGKAAFAELTSKLPSDLFSALEVLQEDGADHIPSANAPPSTPAREQSAPLHRVWFYFPSLSTREKRQHMVGWAASHSLTGFVLAGKPGLLCLEGASKDIDAYMNEIKTVSWSDIPPHQKKVSERFREVDGVQRRFGGMQEITGDLEMHGQRGNRGDMKALEAWLKDRGLGAAFESVILQSA